MRIADLLDNLLSDLEEFEPESLSQIVRFVRKHDDFGRITMLARNVDRSADFLYEQCVFSHQAVCQRIETQTADIQFAALLYIVAEMDYTTEIDRWENLLSSASKESGEYHWSRAMAASYLLHKEVSSEKIRQSA